MIAYPISLEDLEEQIESESPGWLDNAKSRTDGFRQLGYYDESSSIWSTIKVVYMRLQGDCKCAYCERKLESPAYGKIEQDVEHFRPKGNVRAWKVHKSLVEQGVKVTTPADAGGGYYLLPYHPFNYAASCKPCNSALKKDCFPIAGKYTLDGSDPAKLVSEKPLLIYPIGDFDEDPESLIKFHGPSPYPVAEEGHKRHRALVTIAFFKLDDATTRKNLMQERARTIVALHPQLKTLAGSASGKDRHDAQSLVDGFTAPTAPHASCARDFCELFQEDRKEADAVFRSAIDFIISSS